MDESGISARTLLKSLLTFETSPPFFFFPFFLTPFEYVATFKSEFEPLRAGTSEKMAIIYDVLRCYYIHP